MNKLKNLRFKAEMVGAKVAPAVVAVSVAISQNSFVFADANSLMEKILGIVASLIIVLGLILAVMGIVNYASAHSEGDGPAQNKAIGKIAAGIMLVALSAILKKMAPDLVGELDF